MKAVVASKQPAARRNSNLTDCHIIVKHDEKEKYIFIAPSPDSAESGDMYVHLDGYLICPLEMFSQRQLKLASKKYAARRS